MILNLFKFELLTFILSNSKTIKITFKFLKNHIEVGLNLILIQLKLEFRKKLKLIKIK